MIIQNGQGEGWTAEKDPVDMGYEHKRTGSETKGGTGQVLGKRKAPVEKQQEEQQDMIVLDNSV